MGPFASWTNTRSGLPDPIGIGGKQDRIFNTLLCVRKGCLAGHLFQEWEQGGKGGCRCHGGRRPCGWDILGDCCWLAPENPYDTDLDKIEHRGPHGRDEQQTGKQDNRQDQDPGIGSGSWT